MADNKIKINNVQLNTLNSLNRSPTPKSMRNESLNISRSFEDLDKFDKITMDKSNEESWMKDQSDESIINKRESSNKVD